MVPIRRPAALQAELERIAQERLAAEREVTRAMRWEYLRALGECVAWCFVGLVMMGFAFHVYGDLGRALLFGGMLVGYSGMFVSLLSAYTRARERGDL